MVTRSLKDQRIRELEVENRRQKEEVSSPGGLNECLIP